MTGELHPCAGRVPVDWRTAPCSKGGNIEEGGKWWCASHAPSRVAARRRKREEKWDAAAAERAALHERATAALAKLTPAEREDVQKWYQS